MKIDLQLLREILESVESEPPGCLVQSVNTNCPDIHTVTEHIRIMIDDGLMTGEAMVSRVHGSHFVLNGLTIKGHELLSSIRNNTVWHKLREKAEAIGGGFTISIITELGQKYLKELFGFK